MSIHDNRRYYWLRLQRDFFKRHDIRIVESMENGTQYILFYLKLMVESIDHKGELRFSETIPYNDKMLATITNTDVDHVRSAVKIFTELGMMETLDNGTLYLEQVTRLIGSETGGAERKRIDRHEVDNVHGLSENVHQSKSKSKSKSLEKEEEKKELRVVKPPAPMKDELENNVDQWFLSRYSYTSFGKERISVKSLVSKARRQGVEVGADPEDVILTMLVAYESLVHSDDKFWSRQPMTPSALLSMWDRVVSEMRSKTKKSETEGETMEWLNGG